MPTARAHGGAALMHKSVINPGSFGLDLQNSSAPLEDQWATLLRNTVLDDSNRIAARNGWDRTSDTGAGFSGRIVQIFEHRTHQGILDLIATDTSKGIRASSDKGVTWRDIAASATVTDPGMLFINFNDSLYGWQTGGTVLKLVDGVFTDFAPSGIPEHSGIALAAFGRLWVASSNGTEVRYCSLLDSSNWVTGDSGVVSLRNVWTDSDAITALAEFNGSLVVFGKNNIVMWADGAGSALGLDPNNIYVRDTVERVGCIARDTVQHIRGDIWFLSDSGLTSFSRTVSARSDNTGREPKENPFNNLSLNVQDALRLRVKITNTDSIRSVYAPSERFYLLCMPSAGEASETGQAYCFDTRGLLEDGSARCVGIWDQNVPRALVNSADNVLYTFIMEGNPGTDGSTIEETAVGRYAGSLDYDKSYIMSYEGPWKGYDDPHLKFPKKATMVFSSRGSIEGAYLLSFDYRESYFRVPVLGGIEGPTAEYNVAEWANSQWGAGVTATEIAVPLSSNGEYIRVGMDLLIKGSPVAIQQMSLLYKTGRLL